MRYFVVLLLACLQASAQTLYLTTNTTSVAPYHVPLGTTLTIDAIVNGTGDKGVNWTSSGGTLSNANCTANGACTVGIYSATATGVISLTATSHANSSVSKTAYVQFDVSPTPATTYPWFLFTQANLASMQAKATTSNPLWMAQYDAAVAQFNSEITNGWTYTCNSGTGAPPSLYGYPPDYDAYLFSLVALMKPGTGPSGVGSCTWGQIARDVWIYTLTNLKSGAIYFAGNVWSDESVSMVLGLHYAIASGAINTTTDLNSVRSFMAWALPTILNYSYGSSAPATNLNNYQQFHTGNQFELTGQRAMGNNYTQSKILYVIGYALMFHDDTTNDPALTNTCSAARYAMCADYTAGSLHAYWYYAVGGFLLKSWAHLDDPAIVQPVYAAAYPSGGFGSGVQCDWTFGGATYNCMGDGWGGESSEGSWYAYSYYRLRLALNIAITAGYSDPALYGPQVSEAYSATWDMKTIADREFLTTQYTASTQGPGFGYFTTGDTYSTEFIRSPTAYTTETEMLTTDTYTGRTDNTNALLWMTMETAFGGMHGTEAGCIYDCGFVSELSNAWASTNALDMFITQAAGDPTSLNPTDPSSNYPTDWWNNSYNQHQLVRTGWSTASSAVSVYAPNTLIDHEHEFQGRFDVFANGGYITKGRTEFNNYNDVMSTATNSNLVAIVDGPGLASGYAINCLAEYTAPWGGQLWHAYQQGVSFASHSELGSYAYFGINQIPAYDGCNIFGSWKWADTTTAYRDILYIKGSNQVIYYDRDAIATNTSSMNLFLNTTGLATVSGNAATWNTKSGSQSAKYTTLEGGTLSFAKMLNWVQVTAPYENLQTGTTMQASCIAHYADASTGDISSAATWGSSATSVATVSSTGLVTGVAAGTYNLSCGYGSFSSQTGIGGVASPTVTASASNGTWSSYTDNTQDTDWELQGQLKVAPTAGTLSTQFLSTLEWGATGFTPSTASLVQSSAGQGYDCALISTTLGCFMRSLGGFTTVTYPASGATMHYISDLTPNTLYNISGAGVPSSATSDDAGVLTFAAGGTGNIIVSTATAPTVSGVFSGKGQLQGVVVIH